MPKLPLVPVPIAERFDDEGGSGTTLERPGLAKLLRRLLRELDHEKQTAVQ